MVKNTDNIFNDDGGWMMAVFRKIKPFSGVEEGNTPYICISSARFWLNVPARGNFGNEIEMYICITYAIWEVSCGLTKTYLNRFVQIKYCFELWKILINSLISIANAPVLVGPAWVHTIYHASVCSTFGTGTMCSVKYISILLKGLSMPYALFYYRPNRAI